MKGRLARTAIAATIAFSSLGAVACDKKEQNDIGKVGNDIQKDVEQGVDKVDDDDSK